ncbi:MAG: hypothetical protein HRU01_14645 [Myxococcales bacterium]|nr:hypothetical protein [Myxococcales bacterium]
MRGLPATPAKASLRTRRWDAVVLGSALPGLIAAIQIGRRGARVLILEESGHNDAFPGLREPFLMTGAAPDDVLGGCLRALGLPLIDRRNVVHEPLAFQIALPDARLDVGEPVWTGEEYTRWGFADSAQASGLIRALTHAAQLERAAILAAPIVRSGRRPALVARLAGEKGAGHVTRPPPDSARGLPDELRDAPPELTPLLEAQLHALSNLASSPASEEAQARLLGAALEGGAVIADGPPWLRALLRRRIEALFGEFRTVNGAFRLVAAANQPGIALDESGEVWVGRTLVLNAPRAALATAIDQDPLPDLLSGPAPSLRRHRLHLTLPKSLIPEGMCDRVLLIGDPQRPIEGTNVVTLSVHRPRDSGAKKPADLVASSVLSVSEADVAARESEMLAAVRSLIPFDAERLERRPTTRPKWDDEELLIDPGPEGRASAFRLSIKPSCYVLDRGGVAGLGFEGDILLGWRGGEAIAASLGG